MTCRYVFGNANGHDIVSQTHVLLCVLLHDKLSSCLCAPNNQLVTGFYAAGPAVTDFKACYQTSPTCLICSPSVSGEPLGMAPPPAAGDADDDDPGLALHRLLTVDMLADYFMVPVEYLKDLIPHRIELDKRTNVLEDKGFNIRAFNKGVKGMVDDLVKRCVVIIFVQVRALYVEANRAACTTWLQSGM